MSYSLSEANRCIILMADDDDNDVFLFGRALSNSETPHTLMRVTDGFEALKYLRGKGEYADRDKFPAPHLMILDLKMPHFNGFDVLLAIHRDEMLSKLPVVVMSGSNMDEDRARAIKLGAKGYFVKPFGLGKMIECAERVCKEWLPHGCHSKPGYEAEAA